MGRELLGESLERTRVELEEVGSKQVEAGWRQVKVS